MVPAFFTAWLVPMVVGAFVSVSFRSQVVAISLTFGGVALVGFLAIMLASLFGCSPLWTTIPVLLALLLASRIRTAYWLRETFTWRSRLIPLVPVFAIMLAVMIAIPFVRVYSLPLVSWEQIDAYFDQADIQTARNPEKRKALIRHIAEHGDVSSGYQNRLYNPRLGMYLDGGTNDIGMTVEEYLLVTYVQQRQHRDRSIRSLRN